MRILVTGGAGYLGSNLVPMLLDQGHSVTVLDDFRFGVNSLAACCGREGFDVIRGDCRDESLLRPLLAKADVIIPLAALVGAPLCKQDPLNATTINRDAVLSLCKLSSKQQRFIFPNTNSGYGIGDKEAFCTEDTPLRPLSLYGQTKGDAESAVLARGNSISFRLATVFGVSPRMRIDLLVNDFTYRAVTDRFVVIFEGHFRRNYIHNRDVAGAFMHGLENFERMKDSAYNLGLSDSNLTKLELCQKIQTLVPDFYFCESPIGEDPDKRDYLVSNSKLEATGWRPRFSLEAGIRELLQQYRMIRSKPFSNA